MLTEHQLEQRKPYITASGGAAALGLSRWQTPLDYWLEKNERAEPKPMNEAMSMGHRLEPMIRDWAKEQLDIPFRANTWVTRGVLGATLDGMVKKGERIAQIKTGGVTNRWSDLSDWGDENTDQIPQEYIVQVHIEMYCAEAPLCYVPTFLGDRGLVMYEVPWNEEVGAEIVRLLTDWHAEHLVGDVKPDGAASLETLSRVWRVEGKSVPLDPELRATFLARQETVSVAKKDYDAIKAEIAAVLDDAEIGTTPDGLITYKKTTRKAHEVPESTFRTMRAAKSKKQKTQAA